jgi:cell shape-determining protein MreC
MAVPIVGKLPTPYRNRIALLRHRIKWLESHSRLKDSANSIRQLKEELAELLEQEAKADKLRYGFDGK